MDEALARRRRAGASINGMEGTPVDAVISTQALTKHYGPVRALNDLTLDVRRGEIFGFLGPNGAGKSTAIRTLLGFLHATRGTASVLGHDIATDSVEIRRNTGYLPGGIALYDSLTGEQVLDYLVDMQGLEPRRRVELCERLELPASVLRRRVRDYSRGMRQKIGVVQALQHDPELAILDEPTEGLDPLMQLAFYRLLDDLRAEGKTVFFSSHVLSEVERLCDRVAIIRAGHLMAIHDVAELLAAPQAARDAALARSRAGSDDPARARRRGGRRQPDHRHPVGRDRRVRALDRLAEPRGPDDRAGQPRGGVPRVLRRSRRGRGRRGARGGCTMSLRLFRQTLRWQRVRLLVVLVAGIAWGAVIPIIYDEFSVLIRDLASSGAFPEEMLNFGSGSLFTLPGSITLGLQHPLAIAMIGIFAVGASSVAVAGERARGTLEVLLARPISRTTLYTSILAALLLVVLLVLTAILGGMVASAAAIGLVDELDLGQLPLVLLNGFGLWAAFTTFGLAMSVSFDRPGPAIGLTLAWLLIHYFLEILGSLWTDAAWAQEYSLLHHFDPGAILSGDLDPVDLVIVFAAAVIPIVYALLVFPKRDLAAPA